MCDLNYNENTRAINRFRRELMAMVADIREIDIRILNRAVNEGIRYAKSKSPVITGFYRKSWRSAPAVKAAAGGVTKTLVNSADYAAYVNYGHRTVDRSGNTTGFVRSTAGDHLLERTVLYTEKKLMEEFRREVEAVDHRHNR